MRAIGIIIGSALLLGGCNQAQSGSNGQQPVEAAPREAPAPIPPPGTAAEVVRSYADLLEHQHFTKAAKLWDDESAARTFEEQLSPEVHVEIGKPGPTEGAAGSIYTTIPVVFFGDTYRKSASVILRRVNDVPGSTEAQRRWHIERIEWKD
jgi:hypothetical protein